SRSPHEALAVVLLCASVLTLLSLASYHPADESLNAAGNPDVSNWIGPAGAYWADLLLQALGIGAYALAVGLGLGGFRAFLGKRLLPGFREGAGTLLLMLCLVSSAHIALQGHQAPFPAGG